MTQPSELNSALVTAAKKILEDFLRSNDFSQKLQEEVRMFGRVKTSIQELWFKGRTTTLASTPEGSHSIKTLG